MRKVVYSVAASLMGTWPARNGEADWITMDPTSTSGPSSTGSTPS